MEAGDVMYIGTEQFLTAIAVLTGLGSLWAVLYKSVQWLERQKKQDEEIQSIKEEQCVMCYGLLATLDGLKQLGANGNVSAAHQKLEKYLNQSAHE